MLKISDTDTRSATIIKTIMNMKDVGLQEMADMMDVKSTSNISMYLNRDLKYERFEQMLNLLGYEVKIVPKETDSV